MTDDERRTGRPATPDRGRTPSPRLRETTGESPDLSPRFYNTEVAAQIERLTCSAALSAGPIGGGL